MNVSIICIGKLKENYWALAADEYIKRLSRFCKLEIIELAESKTDNVNEESEAILAHIPKESFTIALDIKGKRFDSVGFAKEMQNLTINGISSISFVIGGSNGYNDKVRQEANMRLSFSDFTFPHQLMRVILLEQIYRVFKINANEKYHK